jgi:uncharacterized membrane protein YoaK (UPF0700 family)
MRRRSLRACTIIMFVFGKYLGEGMSHKRDTTQVVSLLALASASSCYSFILARVFQTT